MAAQDHAQDHADERRQLAALDAYLDALRTMPNVSGDAVRAIDHAEAAVLPPLELYLAGDLAQSVAARESERAWRVRRLRTAWQPAIPNAPNADAPHRLAQAVANLMDAGLWPWSSERER